MSPFTASMFTAWKALRDRDESARLRAARNLPNYALETGQFTAYEC